MENFDFQIYDLETSIGRYAKALSKPMVFLRAYGWNNSTDTVKINASMDLYKEIIPLDVWTSMHTGEFNVIELDNLSDDPTTGYTIDDVMDFLEEAFPPNQASVEKEVYVFYAVYNALGQVILSNE